MTVHSEEQLLDLLSKKASEGLSEEEKRQLEVLLREFEDDNSFELAAAAISMVDLNTNEPLPDHLKAKILADADEVMTEVMEAQREPAPTVYPVVTKTASSWNLNWLGWAVASVACIALAISLIVPRQPQVIVGSSPPPEHPEQLTMDQMRAKLMESPDMIKAIWAPGNMKGAPAVSGDVVWSDSKQAGYMTFHGLPVNDKKAYTYQLWIFDETQDAKTPIDGGVFDVQENGDVIIPITAKLKASHPKMFAVTMERPGGVVVSNREKIPVLAKVEL